jgi:hypothetical protein
VTVPSTAGISSPGCLEFLNARTDTMKATMTDKFQ